MTQELLPCPFCGGEAWVADFGDISPLWLVGCNLCDATMDAGYDTKELAIAAWNRRQREPSGCAMPDEVRLAIEAILFDATLHFGKLASEHGYRLDQIARLEQPKEFAIVRAYLAAHANSQVACH
jgi:Lar family restriction alleviation protein